MTWKFVSGIFHSDVLNDFINFKHLTLNPEFPKILSPVVPAMLHDSQLTGSD